MFKALGWIQRIVHDFLGFLVRLDLGNEIQFEKKGSQRLKSGKTKEMHKRLNHHYWTYSSNWFFIYCKYSCLALLIHRWEFDFFRWIPWMALTVRTLIFSLIFLWIFPNIYISWVPTCHFLIGMDDNFL